MSSSLQLNLPPSLLKRVDEQSDAPLNPVENREIPVEKARELVGRVVTEAIGSTPLKAIADKGQVSRWCSGQENPNLAKLIACADRRKAMAKALLKSCDDLELIEEWRVVEKARS